MNKLKLDADALMVETFTPGSGEWPSGTVRGNATFLQCQETARDQTCGPYDTCRAESCDHICGTYFCTGPSCAGSCDICYSNQPCPWTAGGSTCLATCQGNASCPPNCP